MRIGVQAQALVFFAILNGPYASVGQEEALIAGIAIQYRRGLAVERTLIGLVGNGDTAQIAQRFAGHKLAFMA